MDILVVCRTQPQVSRLFNKFVACVGRDAVVFDSDHSRVRWKDYDFCFITKDKLDICQKGRRDVKFCRAADLEAMLDSKYGIKEK